MHLICGVEDRLSGLTAQGSPRWFSKLQVSGCSGMQVSRWYRGVQLTLRNSVTRATWLFFDNGRGHINHVGIILPECHIIHASGKVRIDKLDHFGIFNSELNRYTHQLRIIKRLLPDESEEITLRDGTEKNEVESTTQSVLFG